jgi:pimeloyl-ACP methyl ester carboxylesterase
VRVPHAKVDVIPACGHLPFVEKGDATADKILRFVGSQS